MIRCLLAFAAIACGFLACQSPQTSAVSPKYGFKKINAYVRYLAMRKELYGEITFRTDSTRQLNGQVTLNEKPLVFHRRPKVGLQYAGTRQAADFEATQTFSYTEKDGSRQNVSITLPVFDSVALLSQGVLSKQTGGLLGWQGASFDKKDGLVLLFTDAEGQTFSVNHTGKTNGTQYQILPTVAQRLAEGPGRLEITRKRIEISQLDSLTQWATIEYYCPPISFNVQP